MSRRDPGVFLAGVVLAAGAATRLGQPKQLLPLAGRPLVAHALAAAAAARLDEIVLVLGHEAEACRASLALPDRPPTRVVVNLQYRAGQSTSLRCGLDAVDPRATAAAILLGDVPGVTGALVERVARAFLEAGRPAARPVWHGRDGRRIPGHPVFLARELWPEVGRLRGDAGARALFAAHPQWLHEVAIEGEPPGDVDGWEDYGRLVDARRSATVRD